MMCTKNCQKSKFGKIKKDCVMSGMNLVSRSMPDMDWLELVVVTKKDTSKEKRRERMLNDARKQCEDKFEGDFTDEEMLPISALMKLYQSEDMDISNMTLKDMLTSPEYCKSMCGLADICIKVVCMFSEEKVDLFSSSGCYEGSPTKMVQIFFGKLPVMICERRLKQCV
jgi:hypothetical protein